METKITVEFLKEKFGGNVNKACEYIRGEQPVYIARPEKPFQPRNPTSQDALKYANLLADYESNLAKFNDIQKMRQKRISELDAVLVDYIRDMSGLNTIPPQYRDKVYSKAYQDGHSSGYYSVYQELVELVEIFD